VKAIVSRRETGCDNTFVLETGYQLAKVVMAGEPVMDREFDGRSSCSICWNGVLGGPQ
jgi:hypothetical protein